MNLILGEGLGLRLPEEYDAERWLELFRDPDQLRFGTPSFVPLPETARGHRRVGSPTPGRRTPRANRPRS